VNARVTSALLASALVRSAAAEGGFAAILAKGDPDAGAVLVVSREKGVFSNVYERALDGVGAYRWARAGPSRGCEEAVLEAFLARRRASDPDLWLVELDIPNAERFIAEMPVGA
jgi:hypothetical protein